MNYLRAFSLFLSESKIQMNLTGKLRVATLFSFLFIAFPLMINAQETYTQIWNEIDLVRIINDKWSGELDLAATFSNTPSENNILKTNIQRNVMAWAHYQFSPRWKFSSFLAYYRNKDVPDIGQYEAPEWRWALQGRYYFHKTGFILNTDMRFELRFIADENGTFNDIYRYRQKFKYLQPLNSKILRKGVVFVYASEEIIFRSIKKETGIPYFDCNLFTAAVGYLFTDDLQLELAYVNAYIPRDDADEIDNAISLTLTINNLLQKVGRLFTGEPEVVVPE
jgi:hypothetical protein